MKTKAVVVEKEGKVEIKEYEVPPVADGDMLVKVEIAGICGTDLHFLNRSKFFPEIEQAYPFFLGHEWVGRIAKMGSSFPREDVRKNPIEIGDRVVIYPVTWACGKCYYCRVMNQPNLCQRPPYPRSLPQIGDAFSEYQYIPEGSTVYKIPSGMPLEVSVLVEPVAAALRALERAFIPGIPDRFQGMGPGKTVVVQGTGPIGIILVALSKLCGAFKTIAIGAPWFRLNMCKEFGADYVINIDEVNSQSERVKMVKKLTPAEIGADVVIEAAGTPAAFAEGIELVRRGGTLVEMGHYVDQGAIPINPHLVCWKDIHIFGSWGYGPGEFDSALRVLESYHKKIGIKRIVTHKFLLANIREALEQAKTEECGKVVVIP